MNEYLIKDYTGIDDVRLENPRIFIVNEKELFELLQKIRNEDDEKYTKISVFKIGDCVLDWS